MISSNVSNYFYSIIKNTMETRIKDNIIRPDLIHLLMEARKGRLHLDGIGGDFNTNSNQKQFAMSLTDEDITAQAVIFIFGGYDTTAKLLAFCSYELAVNPTIQEKLRGEIDANSQKLNGKIGYEDLFAMKYLDLVISGKAKHHHLLFHNIYCLFLVETLRKWPPGLFVDRKAVSPFTIEPAKEDERPLHLQQGDIIWVPVYALHRDPNYWSNPDTFDPERFNVDNRGKIVQGTYLPFGLGPRNCIGMDLYFPTISLYVFLFLGNRYALMAAKLFIFHLLANFEIVPTEKSKIPLEICKSNILLLPEHGFWFGLKKRSSLKKTN